MENSRQTLNKVRALSRFDGDEEFYHELLRVFSNDVRDNIRNVNQYFEEQNYEMLMRSAHSITSSAGNVGAESLAGHSRDVEKAVRESNFVVLEGLVANINSEMNKIEVLLRKEGVLDEGDSLT